MAEEKVSFTDVEAMIKKYFDDEWDTHWSENLYTIRRWRETREQRMRDMQEAYQKLTAQEQSIIRRKMNIMKEVINDV